MGAYSKNTWVARVGTGLNRYTDQNNNVYEFTAAPTGIVTSGTPFSADWMNHIEEGIYNCSLNVCGYAVSDQSSAAIELTIPACENIPLTAGQIFVINFQSQPYSNATMDINETGAKPLFNVHPYAAIVEGDIPPGFVAFIAYDGTNYVVLNRAWEAPTKPAGSQFFTTSGTFTVPADVYAINVSACAAGIGRNAGEWTIDEVFQVTPGQTIAITVGTGNTVIGSLKTLTAGSMSQSTHSTKMGYATGYNGGTTGIAGGGYGGAFGFGGGAGAGYGVANDGGGGGAGKGGNGGVGSTGISGAGGGTTGGAGGVNAAGSNAREGTAAYAGGTATSETGYSGGSGSIYGAGGGGGSKTIGSNEQGGCGGGAGGYGAGGGEGGQYMNSLSSMEDAPAGTAAKGCVLIEWGPTYG